MKEWVRGGEDNISKGTCSPRMGKELRTMTAGNLRYKRMLKGSIIQRLNIFAALLAFSLTD